MTNQNATETLKTPAIISLGLLVFALILGAMVRLACTMIINLNHLIIK